MSDTGSDRRVVIDRVVTIVLLLLLAVCVPLASFTGLMFGMISDGCGGDNVCDTDRMALGLGIAVVSPWLVFVVTLVVAIVMMVRRRWAFWVPLAGFVVGLLVMVSGVGVALSGLP